jgi:hypothetical protein
LLNEIKARAEKRMSVAKAQADLERAMAEVARLQALVDEAQG